MSQRTIDLGPLLADVRQAGSAIAPSWPLSSFVAVNPLGGFEHLPFEEAASQARDLFQAETHLSITDYRAEHMAGAITNADLRTAIVTADPMGASEVLELGTATATVGELTLFDLIEGPLAAAVDRPTDAFDEAVNSYLSTWCASFVDEGTAAWGLASKDEGFYAAWRQAVDHDRRVTRLFGKETMEALANFGSNPLDALQRALDRSMVDASDRHVVLEALIAKLPGWAGYARWCDEWAPADHAAPLLRLVDLVAVRAVLESSAGRLGRPVQSHTPAPSNTTQRVDAILAAFATGAVTDTQRATVTEFVTALDANKMRHLWLQAHEHNFHSRLLGKLNHVDPGPLAEPPSAQVVMCIDVRSEGMRRNLEALGNYDTYGFAGFFGVPVRWRPLGSDVGEARCPVLVTPKHQIAERPATAGSIADIEGYLERAAATGATQRALHDAKKHPGAPFALAEASGWFTGPLAAARTLLPGRKGSASTTPATAAAVSAEIDAGRDVPLLTGLTLDERSLFAEAIVRTIGMDSFAPIVVLCGHASATVNNPHASSLDCGACGGAPGGPSARIAAAILNDADVRNRLAGVGVEIPSTTWFVAGEHDTVSDVVTILDPALIPGEHQGAVAALQADFAVAGSQLAAERATRLPGNPSDVRDRGADWAQVRPEWGLAGNAAFVVGPRSITRDVDLSSRVFLHSYDAESDESEVALETIMTAPLIVAQWICSQYYFSTVDNDVFGAGDKMIHNPVGGTVGVQRGNGGDLAVGLPLQSTSAGGRRGHDPLRLLAVIQAPLERIEAIINRNAGLRQLVEGEWIRIAGRSHGHEAWSMRTPAGTWQTWHAAGDPSSSLELR